MCSPADSRLLCGLVRLSERRSCIPVCTTLFGIKLDSCCHRLQLSCGRKTLCIAPLIAHTHTGDRFTRSSTVNQRSQELSPNQAIDRFHLNF